MRRMIIRHNTWVKFLVTVCMLVLLAGCGEKSVDTSADNETVTQVNMDVEEQSAGKAESGDAAETAEEPEKTDAEAPEEEISEETGSSGETEEESAAVEEISLNENIDNKALAFWLATTETPDIYGVYIWDTENETAIEVENEEYYSITKMDELVILHNESFVPLVIGREGLPYVYCSKYDIYKLDDIESSTYIFIQMVELDENLNAIDTDYIIEFVLQPQDSSEIR
ncbi:MAG: hypothetical protein ACI4DW_10545 [Lachnospiraceae bacterium]